jgi:hypothetical protein
MYAGNVDGFIGLGLIVQYITLLIIFAVSSGETQPFSLFSISANTIFEKQ